MAVRTFLALDLHDGIRGGIVEASKHLHDSRGKIRWVAPENLHVTLKFLGDVPDEALSEVCDAAAAAAGQVDPFDFRVRGIVCIPARGRHLRMLWAGIEDPSGRMDALYQALDRALTDLPVRRENRAFKAHVTVARIKRLPVAGAMRRAAAEFADNDFGTQHAEELVAYTSQRGPEGPIYTPIARPALGA